MIDFASGRTALPGVVPLAWPRIALLAAVCLGWTAAASAQVGYSGSLHVVRVDTADGVRTDAVYLLTGVDFERGRLRASLTIPLVAQRSRWIDLMLGPVETGWTLGLSDPLLRTEAEVWRTARRDTAVRLSGTVKLPVASVEDGFSSGKTDVAVGLSVVRFRNRNSVFADLTYWALGDPSGITYRNVPALYVGYGRVLDREYRWSGVISVSRAGSPTAGLDAPVQVGFGVLRVLSGAAAFGIAVDVGLTDGAPNVGVGSTWRLVF